MTETVIKYGLKLAYECGADSPFLGVDVERLVGIYNHQAGQLSYLKMSTCLLKPKMEYHPLEQ